MKMMKTRILILTSIIALFSGCSEKIKSVSGVYEHGVIITNEGNRASNTGSVSYYNPSTDSIYNNIFELANNRILGDVVQSFTAVEDKGFIVVNNSNKVEVVLLSNFKSIGSIDATYPRYFMPVGSGKAYLTINGTNPGEVLVLNTNTLAVTDTIVVGNQPENLLQVGSKVFVANGNWGNDSTVSVIDTYTDKVIKTITVGDGASNLVCVDGQTIWILCQGRKIYNADYSLVIYESDSHLVQIRASDYTILYSKVIGVKGDYCNPYLLSYDKEGNIYYVEADGVHKVSPSTTNPPDNLLIAWNNSSGYSIYGMNVDIYTSNIYIMEPKGFSAAGKFHIYNSLGQRIKTFTAGVAPNGAVRY